MFDRHAIPAKYVCHEECLSLQNNILKAFIFSLYTFKRPPSQTLFIIVLQYFDFSINYPSIGSMAVKILNVI